MQKSIRKVSNYTTSTEQKMKKTNHNSKMFFFLRKLNYSTKLTKPKMKFDEKFPRLFEVTIAVIMCWRWDFVSVFVCFFIEEVSVDSIVEVLNPA